MNLYFYQYLSYIYLIKRGFPLLFWKNNSNWQTHCIFLFSKFWNCTWIPRYWHFKNQGLQQKFRIVSAIHKSPAATHHFFWPGQNSDRQFNPKYWKPVWKSAGNILLDWREYSMGIGSRIFNYWKHSWICSDESSWRLWNENIAFYVDGPLRRNPL